MIFFKPDVCFKLKTLDETVLDLHNRLKNSNNSYELLKIKEFLKLNECDEKTIKLKLKNIYNSMSMQGKKQLTSIQTYWKKIECKFFTVLSECLQIELFGDVQAYCLMDCSPLPLINFKGRIVSLPISESLDNNIRYALSFLVKYFLLKKFSWKSSENINYEYTRDSVYWIMADLVADSLFFYTELKEFAQNTAYKYYYGLKIKEDNLIDYIRSVYPKMDLSEFMQFVLDFVADNMSIFSKFTNRY